MVGECLPHAPLTPHAESLPQLRRSHRNKGFRMLTLIQAPRSGNCYKIQLFMALNNIPFKRTLVKVLQRENQTEEFEAVNPFQQVPVLKVEDKFIWDSQAILVYLATHFAPDWLPEQHSCAYVQMMQWMSVAANEIGNSLQPMRLFHLIGPHEAAHHMGVKEELFDSEGCRRRCDRVLSRLDRQLSLTPWLAGDAKTVADIACYAYVSIASDGKIELIEYPNVCRWVNQIVQLPNYERMKVWTD
jgi:glutathione S-transferase